MPSPPTFRSTFFVNRADKSGGFALSFYPNGADQAASVLLAQSLLADYVAILPESYNVAYARVDNLDHPRDSLIVPSVYPSPGTYALESGEKEFPPDTCFLLQMYGTPQEKNRHFLHGVLSQDTDADFNYVPSAPLITAMAAFTTNLMTNFWVGSTSPTAPYRDTPTAVLVARLTNRKVGRPFGTPRGRRP